MTTLTTYDATEQYITKHVVSILSSALQQIGDHFSMIFNLILHIILIGYLNTVVWEQELDPKILLQVCETYGNQNDCYNGRICFTCCWTVRVLKSPLNVTCI